MDMDELMRLNGIADADAVYSGQRLRLTHAVNTGPARAVETRPMFAAGPQETQARHRGLTTSLNRTYRVELGR